MKGILLLVPAFSLVTLLPHEPRMAQPTGQASYDQKCDYPIFKGNEVDKKIRILAKPEPDFSAQERREHFHEKIILTTVFCGSGEVTRIKVKSGLSDRLDGKAIEAAKKIRFTPGEKDGKRVSQWLIVEYLVQ